MSISILGNQDPGRGFGEELGGRHVRHCEGMRVDRRD